MKKYSLVILSCICWFSIDAQAQYFPFPQHVSYTIGAIKPNNVTQGQLDDSTKSFYDKWKTRYLIDSCGVNQYYVWFEPAPTDSTITVSEGHGYGMMITAYMAGYDPNAKTYFDGLYNFYKAHPSLQNNRLMAWRQVRGCVSDPDGWNSATDGDLDIAYALLLADKQWGSLGAISYLGEAQDMINAIMQDDINTVIWTTKLGDWVSPSGSYYYDTRPSDFMLNHFKEFQNATGNSNWSNVIDECYSLINNIQTNFSPTTGLLPDFIQSSNTTPTPAVPNYNEGPYDGDYYYNACRTPWRIATDYLLSGDVRAKTAVDKINSWIRTRMSNNPVNIRAGYYLNGDDIPGNDYYSAAFVGPFAVGAMVNADNQSWLNATYAHLLSLQLPDYGYYDNTLKMLSMIVLSGNFWTPQFVTGVKEIRGEIPRSLQLDQNYPNPFNPRTTIQFALPHFGHVTLKMYNTMGEEVVTLVSQDLSAGMYKIEWFASNLAGGVYFCRLQTGVLLETKRLLLLR